MRFRLSVRGALALSTALVRPEREGLRGMMAPANRPAVRRARARAFASVSPRDSLGPQVLVVVVECASAKKSRFTCTFLPSCICPIVHTCCVVATCVFV